MNQSNDKPAKIEQKETAPETLTTVSDGIDELLTSIDSIIEIIDLTESEYQAQESKTGKKEDESNQESNNQTGEGQGNQQQSQGQNQKGKEKEKDTMTKDEDIFIKWREIDKKLEEVHESWNKYEVEGMKKGITSEKANEFKKNLNLFTVAIENREMEDIMNEGSRAINSIAVFFDLYKDEIRGDLSKIKHSVYQAFIKSQQGNNKAAQDLLTKTEEYTARIRHRLEKDDDKIKDLDRLSLATSDMKLALEDNNIKLLKIKRDIVLNNIKSLQE